MATRNADVLLLGCGNVGKSHILRYLRKITYGNDNNNNNNKFNNDMDKIPSLQSQSTVGVEIDVLRLNGIHNSTNKKRNIRVREVGSPMIPMWKVYSRDCFCLIYIIDSSNHTQITESTIEFLKILNQLPPNDTNFPILIVNNKIDCVNRLSEIEISNILCFNELKQNDKINLTYMETSFSNVNDGLKFGKLILNWIGNHI